MVIDSISSQFSRAVTILSILPLSVQLEVVLEAGMLPALLRVYHLLVLIAAFTLFGCAG